MKNIKNEPIDIVITWVDGNDVNWINQKNKFLNEKGDSNKNRFRDFENLQYLFRGIEKNMPWVNKIFFVTWGHLPKWLNTNNEKIVIVKHEEFIPKEYLPTFNSNVIEMNLHRIKGLSSKFILFNDDLFILKKLKPTDFFKNDLPKDFYIEYKKKEPSQRHIILSKNYMNIINKYFNKKDFVLKNLSKIFNVKYGLNNFKNLWMLKNKQFQDIYSQHLTQPILKETLETVWKKENYAIDIACKNKFRANTDLGMQLCRYWQLLSGKFVPSGRIGKYFGLLDNNSKIINSISKRKYKIICINDVNVNIDFENAKKKINMVFEQIYPNKCDYEN